MHLLPLLIFAEPLSEMEAAMVYAEEVDAWQIGEQLLRTFEFDDWLEFDKIREESLSTYTSALRQICPGWLPPGVPPR